MRLQICTFAGAVRKLRKLLLFHGFPYRDPYVVVRVGSVRVGYRQLGCFTVLGQGANYDEALRRANINLTSEVLWEREIGIRRPRS
jgi:hypothetical protein